MGLHRASLGRTCACTKITRRSPARPIQECIEAVKFLARTERPVLDPVYTGKAMAELIDIIRKDTLQQDATLVFFHTGGSPVLYAYEEFSQRL